MYTIGDVINSAFRKAGITAANGMTTATPDMLDIGLAEYIEMMQQYVPLINLPVGDTYNPALTDLAGFPDSAMAAFAYELGERLAPIYQIQLTETYLSKSREAMENLQVLMTSVPELHRRRDMPYGQGWKDWSWQQGFYPDTKDCC